MNSSLVLHPHQFTAALTMLDLEKQCFSQIIASKPALQTAILGNDMGLEKTVQIYILIYLAIKFDVQKIKSHVISSELTLIIISSAVVLN